MIDHQPRKLRIAGLLGALTLGFASLIAGAGPQEPPVSVTPASPDAADPVVGTVNREPVSAAEYRMVMERETALVYSYFKREKDMDDHAGYWRETSGPAGPLAQLRERVRDELVRIKVTQALARGKGLIADTSFMRIQHDYTRENARRRAALDVGEVVYGPKQYRSLATYYYVRFGDLRYQLVEALAREAEPGISENEIKAFYDDKTTVDSPPLDAELQKRIRAILAEKQAERQIENLRASARVEMNADLLRPIIPRLDPDPDTVHPSP